MQDQDWVSDELFQSAPPHGRRQWYPEELAEPAEEFQSAPPHGRRLDGFRCEVDGWWTVSIRASAREATSASAGVR